MRLCYLRACEFSHCRLWVKNFGIRNAEKFVHYLFYKDETSGELLRYRSKISCLDGLCEIQVFYFRKQIV